MHKARSIIILYITSYGDHITHLFQLFAWGQKLDKKTENYLIVKFMSPCRKTGAFMWPSREDIQEVKLEFVLEIGVVPDCGFSVITSSTKNYMHITKTTSFNLIRV